MSTEAREPDGPSALAVVLWIVLIAGFGIGLRAVGLGADPPLSLSPSNAEIMDGPWYLAKAVDAARGQAGEMAPQYHKPVFHALGRVAFADGHVSLERAHLLMAIIGGLLVVFGGCIGWLVYGGRAGILSAFFLAAGYLPVGYGRVVLVYGPLTAALALLLLLFVVSARLVLSGRRVLGLGLLAGVVFLVFGLAVGLKMHAILVLPAFGIALVVLLRQRWLLPVVLGIGVAFALYCAFGQAEFLVAARSKLRYYLRGDTGEWIGVLALVKRVLKAPFEAKLIRGAPVACVLGWCGVLLGLSRLWPSAAGTAEAEGARSRLRAVLESLLAVWVLTWLVAIAPFRFERHLGSQSVGRMAIRHLIPVLLPLTLLAVATMERWRKGKGVTHEVPVWLLAPWTWLASYWALGTILSVAIPGDVKLPGWALSAVSFWGLAVASLVATVLYLTLARGRLAGEPLRLGASRVVPVVFACVHLTLLVPMLTQPTYTLRRANRLVAGVLGEGARLTGNFAHMVTYEAPHVTRMYDPPADLVGDLTGNRRYTHLVAQDAASGLYVQGVKRRFGLDLPIVCVLEVRNATVLTVHRYPWAEAGGYVPTPVERRLEALFGSPLNEETGQELLSVLEGLDTP
ncbi:MAG: hypothetical protein ACYS22_20055 [Planctomycetota bacterium]|jgi:hypothetical protein